MRRRLFLRTTPRETSERGPCLIGVGVTEREGLVAVLMTYAVEGGITSDIFLPK